MIFARNVCASTGRERRRGFADHRGARLGEGIAPRTTNSAWTVRSSANTPAIGPRFGKPSWIRAISDPKRLQRVAEACEDYGVRVQYSLFECWLEDESFEKLWDRLNGIITPAEDRLVAYVLDAAAVRRRRKAGDTMVLTDRVNCYIV